MASRRHKRESKSGPRAAPAAVAAASWTTPPLFNKLWPLYALIFAALFAAISHWEVFEYDLFWEIRAGAEILARHTIQRSEEWSHTARGSRWSNFIWLFTVLVALVNKLRPGYAALPWLRSILIGAWCFLFLRLARIPNRGRAGEWLAPLLFAPWLYFACDFRLQMRPDLVAAVLYVSLLSIWMSGRSRKWKRLAGIALLIVWANFHGGTFPFGALLFSAASFFDPGEANAGEEREPWLARFAWIAAAGLCWFATPIGIAVLRPFTENALSYDYSQSGNPDFQPFALKLLNLHEGGWSLRLWLAYSALAAVGFFVEASRLPALYRDRRFTILLGAFLTAMTFNKIRVIHYQMIFLLPLVAAGFDRFIEAAIRKRSIVRAAALGAVLLFIWGVVVPEGFAAEKPRGDRVDDLEIPVGSVAFIKRNRPAGQMLNAYPFGGYLIGELPEYPVSIDGREIPFFKFRDEQNLARQTVEGYAAFLQRHQINLIVEQNPSMSYDPARGFTDTHVQLYPPQEWALVYFDNVSVIYLRRIPGNQAIIDRSEYHFVRRGFPANFGASFKGLPEATRRGFEQEFERCLQDNPRNLYCLEGKAAHQRARGNPPGAIALLHQALAIDPNDTPALLELSSLYEETGKPELAKAAKAKFESLTIPQP